MARFLPTSFGKRKSALVKENGEPVPSFRVLERNEIVGAKAFDGHGTARPTSTLRPYSQVDVLAEEENMFSGLKINRGSGSSNTTKTASTDTSSRHSAVSTAPSSATPSSDPSHHLHLDEAGIRRKPLVDTPPAAPPKTSSGFLNRAGRTFSFGASKKGVHPPPADQSPPPVPTHGLPLRARGMTSSTTSTATPPKVDDEGYGGLDLGGDFGTMFKGFDKRASVVAARDDGSRAMPPRSLTGNRTAPSQLLPPQAAGAGLPPASPHSPHSINSDHSNDGLLSTDRHPHSSRNQRTSRPSDIIEDEDASLLKQSLAASKFLGDSGSGAAQDTRYGRTEKSTAAANGNEDDNMFDNSILNASRAAHRYVSKPPSPPRNRVMTPAQFEQYKQEKERTTTQFRNKAAEAKDDDEDDDDDENYEDDEDEVEKSKQAAKQRKKQEAHMSVYRQQMMKVTGESADPMPRPPLAPSGPSIIMNHASDGSDEDEEIPLAILAAHGFPTKNRHPSRLSTAAPSPNLRASMQPPPQPSRSSMLPPGEPPTQGAGARGSHLPAFARRLPQDPFVGAGLVRNPARESIAMGGGSPAPPQGSVPPGGLIGVIANEERSRAMRRGSPHADGRLSNNPGGIPGPAVDPVTGMPAHMMYGMGNSSMPHLNGMGYPQQQQPMTPGDQAQMQMTQQMQQFMQMQMQFMHMMSVNQGAGGAQPNLHMGGSIMGDMPSRHSFMGSEYQMDPRPMMDDRMRTMSMVQPSSASWIQPVQGFSPSYAPSMAPSERSNVGLPSRYRPVSHLPPVDTVRRTSTMSGALTGWDEPQRSGLTPSPTPPTKNGNQSDEEDDEEGWAAMKAKREKKRSMWRSKKGFGKELASFIS